MLIRTFAVLLATVSIFASARSACALSIHVEWDSSPLVANPGDGPYYIDFTVVSANTANPDNNKFIVHNFVGATPDAAPVATGQASGNLITGFTLTAGTTFLNDIYQQFTPGSALSFDVFLPFAVAIHGTTPDSFAFSILDSTLLPLWTTAPDTGSLLVADMRPPLVDSSLSVYGSDDTNATFPFSAPSFSIVPEPSSLVLFGLGAIGLLAVARRGRKAA